jgi:hypothetical protein
MEKLLAFFQHDVNKKEGGLLLHTLEPALDVVCSAKQRPCTDGTALEQPNEPMAQLKKTEPTFSICLLNRMSYSELKKDTASSDVHEATGLEHLAAIEKANAKAKEYRNASTLTKNGVAAVLPDDATDGKPGAEQPPKDRAVPALKKGCVDARSCASLC